MEQNNHLEESNQFECSICHEVFKEPSVIQCGHTFCLKCVSSESETPITCPLCHWIHTNSELSINNVLKDVIELFKELITPPCGCGNLKSIKYCSKCETFLCEGCLQVHSSTLFLKKHTVDSKEKGQCESVCLEHGDTIRNYCMKCEKLVCSTCILLHHTVDHNQSVVLSLEGAANKQREWFNRRIQFLKQQQQTIQNESEKNSKEDNLNGKLQTIQQTIDALQRASTGLSDLHVLDKTNIDQLLKLLTRHLTSMNIDPCHLRKFNGSFVRTFGSQGSENGQLSYPLGITVDLKGNILVADTSNNRIVVFDSNGTFLQNIGSGQLKSPFDVAVDSNGNIIVADLNNHRVVVFKSDGTFLRTIGSCGSANGKMSHPYGVTADLHGNIYVADLGNKRIDVFDSNGTFLRKFGTTGEGKLRSPSNVIVDSSGNVFVSDWNDYQVIVFNSNGQYVRRIVTRAGPDGPLIDPRSIDIDVNETVVVSQLNNQIAAFNLDGSFIRKFGSSGSGDGELKDPVGVVVDRKGEIFVVDRSNHRIVVFN